MKRNVLISAMLTIMIAAAGTANAEPNQLQEFASEVKTQNDKRLYEVRELLKRLYQMGALDVTDGEVKVKNSFIEELNRQGRSDVDKIEGHAICT